MSKKIIFSIGLIALLLVISAFFILHKKHAVPVVIKQETESTSSQDTLFSKGIRQGVLENEKLDEVSGIAASQSNANVLWTHNDSGDKSNLYLIGLHGENYGKVKLKGISNRDWEDIAISAGPINGVSYIYIAETGDNLAMHSDKTIYRIEEPDISEASFPIDLTINHVDALRFKYPDGKKDAEALMVDPIAKDVFIISKHETNVHVYKLPFPQSITEEIVAKKVGTLPTTKVVAADISPDGTEILIKTYFTVMYWKKKGDESIIDLLNTPPTLLPYIFEPQGEAITWKPDGTGYYTLSERKYDVDPVLYFYARLK